MEIDNFLKWVIVKDILFIDNENVLTMSKLAEKINISKHHPYFYEVLGQLMDEGAVYVYDIVGSMKLIKINHKKVIKILKESPIYEHFSQLRKHLNWNLKLEY